MTRLCKQGNFFPDPADVAQQVYLTATMDNLMEKYGVKKKAPETMSKPPTPKETPRAPAAKPAKPSRSSRRTAMTQEKKEVIKGGAMLARARTGH